MKREQCNKCKLTIGAGSMGCQCGGFSKKFYEMCLTLAKQHARNIADGKWKPRNPIPADLGQRNLFEEKS